MFVNGKIWDFLKIIIIVVIVVISAEPIDFSSEF